ncbi:MAG TPA: hypothetical protein VFL31_00345 [Nitrospiraceae bacterium]|nr:hypothetical protein [Nitrospiraceae bacterium]
MKRVGIFTATRWELDAVRRAIQVEGERRLAGSRCVIGRRGNCRLWLYQMGVGLERASAVCRQALASQPLDLAVSSGFACALVPYRIGELLIGTDVIMYQERACSLDLNEAVPCSPEFSTAAIKVARGVDVAVRAGRFVTVPRVLWRAHEKKEIAAATGAVGLDMESAAVGAAACERQVPFVVIRAVSDLLDEDLPLDFNLFFKPAGWVRTALTCFARPSCIIGLFRLRAQSLVASERITTFIGRFLEEL